MRLIVTTCQITPADCRKFVQTTPSDLGCKINNVMLNFAKNVLQGERSDRHLAGSLIYEFSHADRRGLSKPMQS